MEYNIELTDKDTTPIGRVEFYETCYDDEEGHFFFYGKFGRLKKYDSGFLVIEEIIFELWMTGENFEWGLGVDSNPKMRSLTQKEQDIIIQDFSDWKEDYIVDFG